MNCNDVLPWLETGGPLQRRRAARHVRRCPQCQAAEQALFELKKELAAAPPLSAQLRERWLVAADQPAGILRLVQRNRRHPLLWAVAIAAVLMIAVGIAVQAIRIWGHGERANLPQIATDDHPSESGEITITEVDPATEFARIDEHLAQIQGEMAGLVQDAQRLMAEQQIARLLADHRNWLAASEPRPSNSP